MPPAAQDEQDQAQWLHYPGDPDKPTIILISGDEEYRSEEALPMMARLLAERHGFNCTVLFAQDPDQPGIVDPNYVQNIPGLAMLAQADMMLLFTRFRALPDEQMKHIEDYLMRGKPVLGIRTATHAFMYQDSTIASTFRHYGCFNDSGDEWKGGFGRLVLGEKWINHHGSHKHQSTKGFIAPVARAHPIVRGIEDGDIWGPTDVYGVRLPLPDDSQPIILGQVTDRSGPFDEQDVRYGMRPTDQEVPAMELRSTDRGEVAFNPNDPMMPIAWTKSYQLPGGTKGMAFTSTIGASTDLLEAGTRRLLINAAYWLLGLEVPEQADVVIVGDYQPTQYEFRDDAYWDRKALLISEIR